MLTWEEIEIPRCATFAPCVIIRRNGAMVAFPRTPALGNCQFEAEIKWLLLREQSQPAQRALKRN